MTQPLLLSKMRRSWVRFLSCAEYFRFLCLSALNLHLDFVLWHLLSLFVALILLKNNTLTHPLLYLCLCLFCVSFAVT